jgi:N-acetylmuramoyl-L-alanine amidase
MNVRNHLLEGDDIKYRETPNRGGIINPRYLVLHYTAGKSAQSTIDWLCNTDAMASAHVVLGRDGGITQLAPFNVKTWHAGKSQWEGLKGMNKYSIGIEMDNAGRLSKVGTKYKAWFQTEYPEDEVIHSKHKFEQDTAYWHTYTDIQIERVLELSLILMRSYNLMDVLGHEDIAPGRKTDPGPAFPMANIKAKLWGRQEEEDEIYEVTADALNIRKGPGVEFERLSSPLARGTKVYLIERRDRWSNVDVESANEIEGWVFNKYIRKV